MVEGQEAIDIHQLDCKELRIWPLDPSPHRQKSKGCRNLPTWQYFWTKVMDSRRKFGLDKNGNPNHGREVVDYFHKKRESRTDKILAFDLEGCFGQGIKWDAPSSFDLRVCKPTRVILCMMLRY